LRGVHVGRHVESVRDLVNLINTNLGTVNEDLRSSDGAVPGVRIRAVTPNWLTVAAPHGEGSPGSRPEAVREPGNWRFEFVEPGLQRAADEAKYAQQFRLQDLVDSARRRAGQPSGVVVAVLDTCPKPAQVRAQADAHPE